MVIAGPYSRIISSTFGEITAIISNGPIHSQRWTKLLRSRAAYGGPAPFKPIIPMTTSNAADNESARKKGIASTTQSKVSTKPTGRIIAV